MIEADVKRYLRCAGKTAHLTPKAAAVELKVSSGKLMTIYRCPHCDAYHIGHDVRKGRNK